MRMVLTLLCLCLPTVAFGQADEVKVQGGLYCDTALQVKTVMSSDDHATALQAINTPTVVCGMGLIALIDGPVLDTFDAPEGSAAVQEITLMGISDGHAMHTVQPTTQYMAKLLAPKSASTQI